MDLYFTWSGKMSILGRYDKLHVYTVIPSTQVKTNKKTNKAKTYTKIPFTSGITICPLI